MSDVVGLIPAAGRGNRLPGLVGSKEVLPLPESLRRQGLEVAADCLIWGFGQAGIRQAVVLVRPGKEDIPERLGLRRFDVDLVYEEVGETRSTVETLAAARRRVAGAVVALGFPDVLLRPADGFGALLRRLEGGDAMAVLGLYPNDRPERSDIVELAADGTVREIRVKPVGAKPGLAWMTAVWRPSLTDLMASHVGREGSHVRTGAERRELQPGDVLREALLAGQRLDAVAFPEGASLDIGTPADLARAATFDLGVPTPAKAAGS
ncbi:MAG: nucleotidyltransferase family protein [Thermoanaerobaculia bacterium]